MEEQVNLKYIKLNIDSCKDTNAKTPLCDSCLDTYYMNVDTCTSCANDKCKTCSDSSNNCGN